jgi:hypothetical protein
VSDNDSKSPGEGPERNPDGTYNKSQVGQREEQQKRGGNPTDDPAEAERINRDEAFHRGVFPVAGHGELEPENDPGYSR